MGEFVECVNGLGEASKFLDFPVVFGVLRAVFHFLQADFYVRSPSS